MTQNYIERYWRDARLEDAIKDPPMVARFRIDEKDVWSVDTLQGLDRSVSFRWIGQYVKGKECQVYDAPDPGEGWRLIDPDKDDCNQVGIEFWNTSLQRWEPRPVRFQKTPFAPKTFYRIRITPTVTYVPFAWEDREQLRGRWAIIKQPNRTLREECVDNVAITEDGNFYINGHDPVYLLQNATFIDTGKPVGKEVTQ